MQLYRCTALSCCLVVLKSSLRSGGKEKAGEEGEDARALKMAVLDSQLRCGVGKKLRRGVGKSRGARERHLLRHIGGDWSCPTCGQAAGAVANPMAGGGFYELGNAIRETKLRSAYEIAWAEGTAVNRFSQSRR